MKYRIVKPRFLEAGASEFSIAVNRHRDAEVEYLYMLDTSEEVYHYLELSFTVFNSWAETWSYIKENYPGWWNMKPFFIHPKVSSFILLELKNELKELSIAGKKFWSNCIRPFWRSCLKEDIQELLG